MRIGVGSFIPAAPFQAIASRASRRSSVGSDPTHRQTLPLGGVCVNRTGVPVSTHFFQERRINTIEPEFEDLGAPTDASLTPREFIDRVTDKFTQDAVKSGRKSAKMASNVPSDKLDKAMAAQAKGWEKILEKVL